MPSAAEKYTQDNRPIAVSTPLGKDVLLLEQVSGTERLSGLFTFELSMLALDSADVDFQKVVGQSVTVTLRSGGGQLAPRYLTGFVRRFRQGERVAGEDGFSEFVRYRAEIVPKVWLLTRITQSRIFQQLSVPDILKKVFTGYDVSYQLSGDYPTRDYCTQYRESDFDFASRLMEEEGIYYFFKHTDGGHQIVLADTPQGHPDINGGAEVNYHVLGATSGQSIDDGERIFDFLKSQEVRSGKETLWDYSFEMPTTGLHATQAIVSTVEVGTVSHSLKAGGADGLERFDYPGRFAQRFDGINPGGGDRAADLQKITPDGERTVKLRMQEETWPAITLEGAGDCRQFSAGHAFKLEKHPNADGKYVLIEVEHTASIEGSYVSGQARPLTYRNRFACLPSALPFRPPRRTPRARVEGPQTAVVVGPQGEEIFTDKYGRVKVQFRWDRQGKSDADSSCWVRVGTLWAGKQWGMIHIPRVGQEVLVAFEEGDPDTPIIVGSVYNAADMPPYTLPDNKTQSGVKSRSTLSGTAEQFNELRFEDKKDSEQVYFHAQKDFVRVVENNDVLQVGYETQDGSHKSDDGSQTIKIYKDRTETIETGNETITIKKGKRTETLEEGDEEVTLKQGKRTHKVKSDDTLQVEGNNTITITGNRALTIKQGNETIKLDSGNQSVTLSMGNRETKIEMGNDTTKLSLGASTTEAMQSIELKVGANSIKVDQTGITLKGMMLKLEGEMMVTVKGGMMVQVSADGMLVLKGGIAMIN
jgi:type VI secretion system secreted protein VgrG